MGKYHFLQSPKYSWIEPSSKYFFNEFWLSNNFCSVSIKILLENAKSAIRWLLWRSDNVSLNKIIAAGWALRFKRHFVWFSRTNFHETLEQRSDHFSVRRCLILIRNFRYPILQYWTIRLSVICRLWS